MGDYFMSHNFVSWTLWKYEKLKEFSIHKDNKNETMRQGGNAVLAKDSGTKIFFVFMF